MAEDEHWHCICWSGGQHVDECADVAGHVYPLPPIFRGCRGEEAARANFYGAGFDPGPFWEGARDAAMRPYSL